MCRLAAWCGDPLALEDIVIRPSHSLLTQSTGALEAKMAVNGDGFGVAWYGAHPEPGLYRNIQPAWSDGNLLSLCRHVVSPLFLSHIRASTEGETARANCHPFVSGRWSFAHNGQISPFGALRRALEATLSDALYGQRRGTNDSELLFLLLLDGGLDTDPAAACDLVIDLLYRTAKEIGLRPFLRLSCVFSDGAALYAFRHASDRRCPSLYFREGFAEAGIAIASEPLDGDPARWRRVEPDCLMVCDGTVRAFAIPAMGRA